MGIFAAWYPVKQMAAVREFHASLTLSGIRDIIAVEIHVQDPQRTPVGSMDVVWLWSIRHTNSRLRRG